MLFWIIASMLGTIVLACLLVPLYTHRAPNAPGKGSPELQALKHQWAMLDTDTQALSVDDAQALRRELSRRILAEDRRLRHLPAPTAAPKMMTFAAGMGMGLTIAAAFGLYAHFGAAGYADQPRNLRLQAADTRLSHLPSQKAAEAMAAPPPPKALSKEEQRLLQRLRDHMNTGVGDVTGLTLLAQNEAAVGRYDAAVTAQKRLIDLKAENATSDDYAIYADYMVLAASGVISRDARDAIAQSQQRDPGNPQARYLTGLLMTQIGRGDIAYQIWSEVLAMPNSTSLPPDTLAMMQQALPALKWLSGGGTGLSAPDNPLAPQP